MNKFNDSYLIIGCRVCIFVAPCSYSLIWQCMVSQKADVDVRFITIDGVVSVILRPSQSQWMMHSQAYTIYRVQLHDWLFRELSGNASESVACVYESPAYVLMHTPCFKMLWICCGICLVLTADLRRCNRVNCLSPNCKPSCCKATGNSKILNLSFFPISEVLFN